MPTLDARLVPRVYDGGYDRLPVDVRTVALFRFDEGSGSTVVDATGAYTATLNAATWAAGDYGNFGPASPPHSFADGAAIVGDGAAGYATIPSLLDTPPANGTIEFWHSPASTIDATHNTGIRFLSKFSVDGGTVDGIDLHVGAGGSAGKLQVVKYVSSVGVTLTGTTASFPHDVPVHVALTWGTRGFELWVNGILEASDPATTSAWTAGTDRALTLLAYNQGGSVSLFAAGTICGLRVSSCQRSREEIRASYQQRRLSPVKASPSRWTDLGTVLAAGVTWEGTAVFEPHPIVDETGAVVVENDGSVGLIYSGINTTAALGVATSSDGETWTKYASNPVIGASHGGQTGHACRNFALKYGGTYYVWAADGVGDARNDIRLYTATARTGPYTKAASPAFTGVTGTWFERPANVSVWRHPSGTWYASVASYSPLSGYWEAALFTADAPTGPWTAYGPQPGRGLQIGGGMYSHLSPPVRVNGLWQALVHAATGAGLNLPTHVYRVTSPDLLNWTPDPYGPEVAVVAGETVASHTVDQRADPVAYEFGGFSYLIHDRDANVGGYWADIRLLKFAGPLSRIWTVAPGLPGSAEAAGSASQVPADVAAVAGAAARAVTDALTVADGKVAASLDADDVAGNLPAAVNSVADGAVDNIMNRADGVEGGGWTLKKVLRLIFAATTGPETRPTPTKVRYLGADNSTVRIEADVSAGRRNTTSRNGS